MSASDKSGSALPDAAALVSVLLLAVAGWWVMAHGVSGPVPLHFGLDGRADRWGDRSDAAHGLWIMAAAMAGLGVFTWIIERQGQASWRAGIRLSRGVLAIVFGFLGVLFGGLGMGWINAGSGAGAASAWGMVLVSVLMLTVGVVMGRARPNPLFGVRTFWTLTSRLSWDKSNRLGGRLLSAIGLIGLFAAPFAPQPLAFRVLIGAVLLAAAITILESWRVWSIDPDRKAGRDIGV